MKHQSQEDDPIASINKHYCNTQVGYAMVIAQANLLLLLTSLMVLHGFNWLVFVVSIVLGVSLGLFPTLTVEIESDFLKVRFGAGIIHREFSLSEIESCEVVTNPWYYGWGIRVTPHGWCYSVGGFSAVELRMKSGLTYRIGTDEPEKLKRALSSP